MKKKGVLLEIGAVTLIVATTLGILFTATSTAPLYYGDSASKTFLDYEQCPRTLTSFDKHNLVLFASRQEAEELGYHAKEGCVSP